MKPKHFPVRTETTLNHTHYVALCGYESDDPKEFVNPQQYKPHLVAECCKQYDKLESVK